MTRAISIFGATGSVGRAALSVIADAALRAMAEGDAPPFDVDVVAAGRDVEGLAALARQHSARLAVIADPQGHEPLKAALAGTGIETAAGVAALEAAATRPVHRLLAAIVGNAGLRSTLAALRAGNSVALANKEAIVCGGDILKAAARASGARILPVDSEHNAIFQVLDTGRRPESLILTASGGPFRTASLEAMRTATPAQAIAHPNWSMGAKISIDSATLMNKGLELIEATHLFDMPEDRIEVLVHPQSVVHSMVRYPDGSVLAQLGVSDMRTPIAYALGWPDSIRTEVPRLDFAALRRLDFEALDESRFGAIALARRAARAGCLASTVLNCANEVAVAAFAAGQCGLLDITRVTGILLDQFLEQGFDNFTDPHCIDTVMALDAHARRLAERLLQAG
jgi:1-deoxy-D-xylulose-5-phosphate reductoisomerase